MMLETIAPDWLESDPPVVSGARRYTGDHREQDADLGRASAWCGEPQVAAIVDALTLTPSDCLLQLGCGSGELSRLLFPHVGGFLGVDRSASCVACAQRDWGRVGFGFTAGSVAGYTATAPAPWRFTAVLCHSGLGHLTPGDVLATLRAISIRFRRVDRVLVGAVGAFAGQGRDLAALASAAGSTGWRIAEADLTPRGDIGQAGTLLLRDARRAVPAACSAGLAVSAPH